MENRLLLDMHVHYIHCKNLDETGGTDIKEALDFLSMLLFGS